MILESDQCFFLILGKNKTASDKLLAHTTHLPIPCDFKFSCIPASLLIPNPVRTTVAPNRYQEEES
jgi:hypothetical protein